MAYVVWRVVMKKYTRFRLGLWNNLITPTVTPSEKATAEKSEETACWTEEDEETTEFSRKGGLSKSKRVKSYIQKKCKDVEVKVRSRSKSGSRTSASWYMCTEDSRTEGGTAEPAKNMPAYPVRSSASDSKIERPTELKIPVEVYKEKQEIVVLDQHLSKDAQKVLEDDNSDTASEGTLLDESQNDEIIPLPQIKVDVAGLVEKYFVPVFPPEVRTSLVREARDLLVTSYLGDLNRFESEFCIPASLEARRLKEESENQYCGQYPPEWPLCVHGRLCTHLGGPGPGSLLPGDGYLALTPHLALESRAGPLGLPEVLSPQALMADLPAMMRALVVSAERSMARFPLEELAYPCSNCGRAPETCNCHAVERRDSGIQTSPMYEMDSSIPHIDSDDEHESLTTIKSRDCKCFTPAERLSEFNETHLNSGIYLPGLHDNEGRALLVIEADKLPLETPEAARLIHYLATLPPKCDRTRCGLSVLTSLPLNQLDALDKTLLLVTLQERITFSNVIVWTSAQQKSGKLPKSRIEYVTVADRRALEEYLPPDQVPRTFGGDAAHDQTSWTDFFISAETFTERCRECGRRLVSAMSSLSGEVTRQQAVQDAKALSRAVTDPTLIRLRDQGLKDIEALSQKALRIPASEDVRFVLERVERLFKEVDGTAEKLEEMVEKRRVKLKDIQRIKALEKETEQVLSWLSHKGDDWLRKHKDLANTLPAIKQQEQDFEQFYFISMRQLDKGSDLLEEAVQCSSPSSSGLRDLARSLKNHLRGFSDRLEDTRERLEDTSRCFYLLDRAYEWALEAMKHMSPVKGDESQSSEPNLKRLEQYLMAHPQPLLDHFSEMIALATKLDNDKLLNQCKLAQRRCEDTAEQIKGLLGPEPRWPTRRRSAPCRGESEDDPDWNGEKMWHYAASDEEDDKLTSSADNTTEGSESCPKECEEIDENETSCGKAVSPIPVNSHLHSDLSVEVDGQGGTQTLKTKKTMLLIMKEMIQTERDYVRSLQYVIENYIPELVREDIPQALRGQRNVVFGNIEKIFEFHSHYFLQELEKCEQSPLQVGQCFLRHEKKFYLYALYNKNKPKSDALMSEYGSTFFKAKQVELGDKMDLASYLLKPVQRMGKYALLLQQLMKASRQEVLQLKDAENMVRFQLRHGNDLLAMDSLRDCDVNVKEQGRLLRQNEFVVWQGTKKFYRHVFLFEELILFSKARRFPDNKNLDLYIYKHSIKTSDIGMTAKVGESSTKFEIWFRKRKPNDTFTLQAISEEVKHAWTEELSSLLWKQALRNREIRLAEMSSMGIGNKPCLDIRPSANQIFDRSISIAQLSKTAPRFRNSIAVSPVEQVRKRPHSIISVTSSSSNSSTSSTSSTSSGVRCERRESSQCSSGESGIVSDWNTSSSVTSDSPQHHTQLSIKL